MIILAAFCVSHSLTSLSPSAVKREDVEAQSNQRDVECCIVLPTVVAKSPRYPLKLLDKDRVSRYKYFRFVQQQWTIREQSIINPPEIINAEVKQ